MPPLKQEEPCGYLLGDAAFCSEHRPEHSVPLYPVNIQPYNQTCEECGVSLHAGGLNWPLLFDGSQHRARRAAQAPAASA